ncbi:hypothetical protein E2C01_072486 [Portunus trituberculatus]|uniref:Uncharacterized protein n=1 Tax=Portunus trituberculatus TaxID=210409 RepID=A0A5B7I7A5_PORTR|nr:hypothetical protein [Portunus trituberculatus]
MPNRGRQGVTKVRSGTLRGQRGREEGPGVGSAPNIGIVYKPPSRPASVLPTAGGRGRAVRRPDSRSSPHLPWRNPRSSHLNADYS